MDLNSKGESPKKRGPVSYISQVAYKALCIAFASMLRINQLNSKTNPKKTQIRWLMNTMRYIKSEATELWKQICRNTADEHMQVNKVRCAEERQVKWTTFQNLNLWFDSWEKVLDELGFFEVDAATGKKFIPKHKLKDIVNFNETCLSLDGSTITRGGRPEGLWEDSNSQALGS